MLISRGEGNTAATSDDGRVGEGTRGAIGAERGDSRRVGRAAASRGGWRRRQVRSGAIWAGSMGLGPVGPAGGFLGWTGPVWAGPIWTGQGGLSVGAGSGGPAWTGSILA